MKKKSNMLLWNNSASQEDIHRSHSLKKIALLNRKKFQKLVNIITLNNVRTRGLSQLGSGCYNV